MRKPEVKRPLERPRRRWEGIILNRFRPIRGRGGPEGGGVEV
jgi:hypothetical protein